MEIRSDLHHEVVTRSFHDDFRDEEEDDEENRFIISLDDIDMKDEFLDEFEETPSDPKSDENIFGQNKLITPTVNSHKPSSLTENTNLTGASINHNNSGKNHVFLPVPQDVRSGPRNSPGDDKIRYNYNVSHSDFGKFRRVPDQSVKDGLNTKVSERIASSEVVDLSLPCNGTIDGPPGSITSHAILTQGSGPDVNNDNPLVKPTSQSDCSCIMCYQGRGIIDSNHIPKAAKRRLGMAATDNPIKAKKLSPKKAPERQVVASSLQTLINKKINSVVAKSASSHAVPQIIPVTDSSLATPHLHHGLLQTPSLMRKPDIQPNFKTPQSSQLISTARHMVNTHSSLPSLTRKPDVPITVAPTVSLSPVVSKMASQANFTLTSQTQSIISTPTTKINTSPTEKTQVVLVNKSSLDKQVADINTILKRATKVDLSNPGMVLVHFKPSSKSPVKSDSSKLSVSSYQSNLPGLPTKGNSTSPPQPCLENALFGLVKTHLTSVSSSNVAMPNTKLVSSRNTPLCDSSARQKNPFTSKPHLQYSLINGTALSTPANKNAGSVPLPPPPPLVPRPGCNDNEQLKHKFNSSRATKVFLDEQPTETLVLPLPKRDSGKPASNLSVDISKQDELLSSPSLFTFSSPYDLSPKKSSSRDMSSNKAAVTDDSVTGTSFYSPIHSIIPSSSSVTLANPIMISPLTASLLSSPVTVTTQSPAVQHHNSVLMTSPSVSPLAVAQCHSTKHQTPEMPGTFSSRQTSCGQTPPKTCNILQAQSYSIVTTALSSQPPVSTSCSTSSSSQSSVSIMSGLKVKIRLKDSLSENNETLCSNEEQKSNSKSNDAVTESSERRHSCESLAGQNATQFRNTVVSQSSTDSTSGNSETATAGTVEKSGTVETAEEMFKRFEDQAMQQVYNAQFGVGEIQRSLRPNRTTTVTTDFLYLHSKWGKESKKKKTDEEKTKTITDEPRSTGDASVVNKNVVKVKRKRSLSGEERQKQPEEKSIKLDINQYPKLLQDNSILNRKTIYTPNILAGHKVFVKFNVFSNSQSGKSFLVPFFNIGGSRTQFDVEDMEYINKAVVEFEKEEKSCARHLLYYSREGNKAAFLRKECGLKSNDLSSKSYKKCSFILEGYKREKPKQVLQPVEDWKVDSQVQIEIDRAEQDSESDAPKTSEENKKTSEEAQTLSPLKRLLSQSVQWNVTHSHSASSILSDDSLQFENKPCDGSVCDRPSGTAVNSTKDINKKCVSHRHSVNILKRQLKNDKISSTSSPESVSHLSPVIGYTKKLKDLVMSGDLQNNASLSSSCETLLEQTPTICKDHDSAKENLPTELLNCKPSPQILPQIKTEVEDEGYEQALTGKPAEELAPTNLLEITIKSEPIDDYTESLARSMNISLQSNTPSIHGTVLPDQGEEHDKDLKAKLDSPSVSNATPLSSANHVEPVGDQNIKKSGTGDFIKKLDTQSKDTEENLPPPSDVLKSVSKETLDASSMVTDEGSPLHESENTEDSSSYPDSSPLHESSDITSSSDVKTSDEEEDDELSMVTTSSCMEGPASSSSCLMSENTLGLPANSKITSLVESLKQRLTESRSTFPPVMPTSNIRLRKKRKKKKRRDATDPKCMKKNVSSSNSNSILNPAKPIHSTTSKSLSDQLPSNSSLTISDPASQCEISQGQPVVDIKPELPLPAPSSLNSLSILTSSSTSSVTRRDRLTKSSLSMGSTIQTNQDNTKNSTLDDLSPSCSTDSPTESVNVVTVGSAHLTFGKPNPCDNIPSISKDKHPLPKSGKGNLSQDDSQLLIRDSRDLNKTLKKGCASFKPSSPTIPHSSVFKSNLQDVSLPNNKRNGEAKEGGGRDNEVKVKPEPDSDSLPHLGEPEIDVGTEEVMDLSPIKQERPELLGNFLSSPPVPSFGRKYIKDFTREHDLMVPLVTMSRLKSNANSDGQPRASKAKGTFPRISPKSKEGKKDRKSASKETGDVSTSLLLEKTTAEVNVKPSVASLLCEKLAIEVEPVIPKVKNVRGVSSLSQASIFPAREQHTPLPGHKSFNRPTLNAIFGVDNVVFPPLVTSIPWDGDEEPTDIQPEKQSKRQVALKGTRSRKIACRSNKQLPPPMKQPKTKSKTSNAGVEKVSVSPSVPSIPNEETQGKQRKRQVAMKGTRSRKITSDSSKRSQPQTKRLKTKSCTQSSPPKERMRALLRKGSQIKRKLKSPTSNGVCVIQRQKFNLQSCFRTWRQLSHEESKNKQIPRPNLQLINVTPCSVVLQRLEDMKLDSNGQPLGQDTNVGEADPTEIDDDTTDATALDNNVRLREIRCANLKKRKKRPIMTIAKRRGRTREKKKDIVDYYTTMLDSLRKKAQLLEEEALKNELKKIEEITPESKVEEDPAEEESNKTKFQVDNEHSMEDTEIISEQSQNVETGTEMETSASQDSTSKIELNETKNTDLDILDFHSDKVYNSSQCTDKEAESSPFLDKVSNSSQGLNKGSNSSQGLDKESESSPCLDKESKFSQGIDKESESSPCLDKESNSPQGLDKESESSPCIDKGSNSSQCLDKESESSPCLNRGSNSSQCLDKESESSPCLNRGSKSPQGLDKESESSPCLDNGSYSSPCHHETDKQDSQPVQKERSSNDAVGTNSDDSVLLKLNQQLSIVQEKEDMKKNSLVELVSDVPTDQQTMASERKNVEGLVCDDSKEQPTLSDTDNKFTSSGETVVSLPETQNNKDCKDSEKQLDFSNGALQKPDPLEQDELNSPSCDKVKRTESEQVSTTPPSASGLSYGHINSHSSGADNGYLSDSSEVGCLVIDYDTESELEHTTATTTTTTSEVPCVEAEKKSTHTPIPSDISDLMSDSNFRTKDIVLGFENDLGADTVISTLSQADMDDMFLLEEDEDESSIGMIAEEEVERLLGLDVTAESDGKMDPSVCANQKDDNSKMPAFTPLSPSSSSFSSSQSTENLPSNKLHWTPIVQTEAKLTNGSSGNSKNTDIEQLRQSCSAASDMDYLSPSSSPPSQLQEPVKKLPISPSWNRLLGSEALKEMEKSAEETIPSSSQPSHEHQNRAPLPKGKMKLKFCAGALSKALKLSAEMKRVFSDGLAPGMSTDQQTSSSEKKNVGLQKSQVNKIHEDSKAPPNMSNAGSKIDKFTPQDESKRGNQLKRNNMLEKPKMNTSFPSNVSGQEKVQQTVKICHAGPNGSVVSDCQDESLTMQEKRETRSRAQCGESCAPKRKSKDKASFLGPSGKSDEVSISIPTSSVISTSTTSKDGAPGYDQTLKLAPVSQTLSLSEPNSQPKSLALSAKRVDLISMLKLKLNPLFSSNKIKLPDSSNPKTKDTTCETPSSSKGETCVNKISTSEKPLKKQSDTEDKYRTNLEVPFSISTSCMSSSTKESSHHNSAKSSISTVSLAKPVTISEPSKMASKLSNILKNIQKPVIIPKQSSAASSSKDQHSSESGMKKRLRSSPRQPQSQNDGEADKRNNSSASVSVSLEDSRMSLKKDDEEEKTERSFFDCLSDVIPAASWEES